MADLGAFDYEHFKKKVNKMTGLNLDAYKQGQMERRIRSFMDRAGAVNFTQYGKMLETNQALLDEFMNRVTINVSEMFRNPEQYKLLESRILPDLLKRSKALRVWSAGCSFGQEPYSLAICLEEAAPLKGHSIVATDIDDRALASTKNPAFSSLDVRNLSPARKERWFAEDGDRLKPDARLRGMMRVDKLDLLKDPFPKQMDLIVCRNVVIYFTDETKDELYRRFFASLKPQGYLFVGGTERINKHGDIGYLNPYPFIYQKP